MNKSRVFKRFFIVQNHLQYYEVRWLPVRTIRQPSFNARRKRAKQRKMAQSCGFQVNLLTSKGNRQKNTHNTTRNSVGAHFLLTCSMKIIKS